MNNPTVKSIVFSDMTFTYSDVAPTVDKILLVAVVHFILCDEAMLSEYECVL